MTPKPPLNHANARAHGLYYTLQVDLPQESKVLYPNRQSYLVQSRIEIFKMEPCGPRVATAVPLQGAGNANRKPLDRHDAGALRCPTYERTQIKLKLGRDQTYNRSARVGV